ncbi:MAG: hypothetical protein WC343_12710 [Bacilli bacterium]|jgi:hypothetical protein
MLFGVDVRSFFDNLYYSYQQLPDDSRLIVYIILILSFILLILLIIMFEQSRLSRKITNKQPEVSEKTEVLNLDISDIDESNEKTRNLKEITDKIQAEIDNRTIDLTKFEQDQEETSIISYDELMKSVGKKVESPKTDFSLPDLVHKIEVDEEVEKETPFTMPVREEKFKSSLFISPVFGIQDQNRRVSEEAPVIKQSIPVKESIPDKEETFLEDLISFRNNLE